MASAILAQRILDTKQLLKIQDEAVAEMDDLLEALKQSGWKGKAAKTVRRKIKAERNKRQILASYTAGEAFVLRTLVPGDVE